MGGYFSSTSYMEEWEKDGVYCPIKENTNKRKRKPPSSVDLAFDLFTPIGDTNMEQTANYMLMFALKSINCLPADFREQCQEFKLTSKPKNSLNEILNVMKVNYATVRTSDNNFINIDTDAVHKDDIKNKIKESSPVYISMGVNALNYTATKHEPLYTSDREPCDYSIVGILIGYQHDLFKIVTGDGSAVFATEDYINSHVHELWTLTANEVFDADTPQLNTQPIVNQEPKERILDTDSDIVKYTAKFVSDSDDSDDNDEDSVAGQAETEFVQSETGQKFRQSKKRSRHNKRKTKRKIKHNKSVNFEE
jgi:hypothetical protein